VQFADYQSRGIVNLVSSLVATLGGTATGYPPCTLLPPQQLGRPRHLVLLVVDGLGYEFLCATEPDGILRERLLGDISSVVPPSTAAAVPVFLTGRAPAQHGFTGWFTWFKELGCVAAVLPFTARQGGMSLTPGGVDPRQLSGASPLFPGLPVSSHVVSPRHIAQSTFNRAFSAGATIHGYDGLDGLFASLRRIIEAAEGPTYSYAYWPGLDALAHEHGIGSGEVLRHFRELDQAFGAFVAAVAATGTALVVTADHGFVDSPAERQLQIGDHPDLEACLSIPLCGEPRFAYCYVHPHKAGEFESYVRERLSHAIELVPSQALLAQAVFGPGAACACLEARVGDYVMVMKDNYVVKDRLPGESPFRQIGVHGGLSRAELRVPLVYVPA
jgi:predicted AlkP superfamily pyrophosphatase or phosphodiesterase